MKLFFDDFTIYRREIMRVSPNNPEKQAMVEFRKGVTRIEASCAS
jgi:hypothetical protein